METVWKFKPRGGRFSVSLAIEYESNYRYDGDDSDGETQRQLDSGELVAFDSFVCVWLDGRLIGQDSLGGSVYYAGRESEFWTAHRDPDPMNRNCSLMRAARGSNVCIGHYFPDMVREAIRHARAALDNAPRLRAARPTRAATFPQAAPWTIARNHSANSAQSSRASGAYGLTVSHASESEWLEQEGESSDD